MSFSRIALAVLVLSASALADEAEEDIKRSAEAEARAEKLRQEIGTELPTLKPGHWAGRYYQGDGLGVNVSLDIAPKAGFVFEWHGCLGLYDRNYGKVTEKDGELHLTFELKNMREGFQGLASSFLPVKWGERTYLIPDDEIVEFCNGINFGWEPREDSHGFFLLRDGDCEKKVTGFPSLPKKYRPYLLKKPIETEIVKLGKTASRPSLGNFEFKETSVVLGAGKKQGVLPGMELHVYEPNDAHSSAIVKKVSDDSSEAVVTWMDDTESLPKVGWKVSTLASWKRGKKIDEKKEHDDAATLRSLH